MCNNFPCCDDGTLTSAGCTHARTYSWDDVSVRFSSESRSRCSTLDPFTVFIRSNLLGLLLAFCDPPSLPSYLALSVEKQQHLRLISLLITRSTRSFPRMTQIGFVPYLLGLFPNSGVLILRNERFNSDDEGSGPNHEGFLPRNERSCLSHLFPHGTSVLFNRFLIFFFNL